MFIWDTAMRYEYVPDLIRGWIDCMIADFDWHTFELSL